MTGRHWQELAAALADSESDVVYEKYLGLTGCRVSYQPKWYITITLAGIGSIGQDYMYVRSFRTDELNPSAEARGVRVSTWSWIAQIGVHVHVCVYSFK